MKRERFIRLTGPWIRPDQMKWLYSRPESTAELIRQAIDLLIKEKQK